MSEFAPSSAPGQTAVDARPALTPEAIEAVLSDFRGWLQQAAAENISAPTEIEPEFSWHDLVSEFTALRHEVNLQTRAARAQLEQGTQALEQLGQAVAEVQASRQSEGESVDDHEKSNTEILRPVLKTLVDVHDAMQLAQREVLRVQQAMNEALARSATASAAVDLPRTKTGSELPRSVKRPTQRWRWWPLSSDQEHRMESKDNAEEFRVALRQSETIWKRAADQARQMISSVLVGYTMGLQRIERALAQQKLAPIECIGLPFDPECMEVVEIIAEPGRQGTEVVREVRRGYYWHGKLFRSAQVCVTRP